MSTCLRFPGMYRGDELRQILRVLGMRVAGCMLASRMRYRSGVRRSHL
jgi:hypothetical protein